MEFVRELSRLKNTTMERLTSLKARVGLWQGLLVSLGLAGVTGLSAQIRVPIPLSPVPITGQVFAVLLIGFIFGKNLGLGSQMVYAGLGGLGLPWFAGIAGGYLTLAGPTGGYILGFIPAIYLVGLLSERYEADRLGVNFLISLVGVGIIYFFGSIQLSLVLGAGLLRTIKLGVVPFIWVDLIKVLIVAIVVKEIISQK